MKPGHFALLLLLIGGLVLAYSLWPKTRVSSQPVKIAILNYSQAAESSLEGLREGMAALGYEEGRDIHYEYQGVIKDTVKLLEEAKRLVSMSPDLIYTISTPATEIAKQVSSSAQIPVVFAPVSNPVEAGIVTSLKNPGGNVTGVTFGPQEPKRLDMLIKFAPHVRNIFVPYNPRDKSPMIAIQSLTDTAALLGVTLVMEPIASIGDIERVLSRLPDNIDAIFLPTDSLVVANVQKFAAVAVARKIPLTCPQREGVKEGALFSYGFSVRDAGVQAARLVDLILKGAHPSDLPVELTDFLLTINLSVANQIGMVISDGWLRQAEIIH